MYIPNDNCYAFIYSYVCYTKFSYMLYYFYKSMVVQILDNNFTII